MNLRTSQQVGHAGEREGYGQTTNQLVAPGGIAQTIDQERLGLREGTHKRQTTQTKQLTDGQRRPDPPRGARRYPRIGRVHDATRYFGDGYHDQ